MNDRKKLYDLINQAPSVRARFMTNHLIANGVVVREKGEWDLSDIACEPKCSICGEYALERGFEREKSNFCPNCGADMREWREKHER